MSKDHSHKLVSRRDFFSQGFFLFAGSTLVPSPLRNVFAQGIADEACGSSATNRIPFLVIDAAGGAALPANFLVRGKTGELLPSYHLLGWDPRNSSAVSEAFGVPMAAQASGIFQGINQRASAEARARFRMGIICHSAQSDTSSNELSALSFIVKYGNFGNRFRGTTGTVNSNSGGNSQAAGDKFDRPLFVRSVLDLIGAVGFPPISAFGSSKPGELESMMRLASTLSEEELEKWQSLPQGKELSRLVKCAFKDNSSNLTQGGDAFDARKDLLFQAVYQINLNTPVTSKDAVFSSLVKGVLTGTTGPSVLTIGGCDYHDQTSTLGDSKDLEIGQTIGQAVEAAHRLKTPLFLQLITDGGCSNEPGTRIWRSDDNDKCLTMVGIYRPEGAIATPQTQIGYYNDGQSANLETLGGLGKKVSKVAAVVYANYLRLHYPQATLSEFQSHLSKVVPSDFFTNTAEIEKCLLWG